MSISSDLSRIQTAKSGLASKIPASGLISTYPSQIQDIIDDANATTGETDTTLADAVETLIDGYGQGGSGGIVITDTVDAAGGTIREITAQEISGTLSVTQNGTYNVTQYASAEVDVSGGGGAQTGTFTIASNTKTVTISLDDADIKFIVALVPNPTQADPDAGGWKTTMILYFPSENLSKSFAVYTSGSYFSSNNLSAIVDGNDITFNVNYNMKAGDTFTWYAG